MAVRVDFEWDDAKAESNVCNHDVSFDVVIAVFADPYLVEVDTTRPEDHEARQKAIGVIGDLLFTVVFTMRGDSTRLISARRANKKEERLYGYRSSSP